MYLFCVLLDLTKLAGIVALLIWLRQTYRYIPTALTISRDLHMAADFSLKRFLRVAQVGSTAMGFVIGLIAGPAGNVEVAIIRGIGGALFGFLVMGWVYLFVVAKDLVALNITDEELNPSEVVLLKTAGSVVHCRKGRPLRFWEGVGGKLFLTNQALEFRAHRGQPWVYRLTIPLGEIAQVTPCKILGLFPGGLRVERVDGSVELFSFGVLADNRLWAAAITAARVISEGGRTKVLSLE